MLTAPWALWALISVPIVLGIYFFRTRSRRREVSSLFLWVDRNRANQGGRRIQRLQLPLLILLELLALILLAVAASRPMIRLESMGRPTAIILDTSYSMTAVSDGKTVRQRAVDDLHRMLETQIGFPIQFILAGVKPQLVAGRAKNSTEAREILQNWTCESLTSDLDAAVSLASNIVTQGTKILVVTDHAPNGSVAEGKLLWKSYGKPVENFAVIHASRVLSGEKDRLLLEIAHFFETAQMLRMTVIDPERQNVLFRDERLLEPLEVRRLRTGIPQDVGTIEVRLADDALAIDNRLTILPPNRRPIRVRIGNLPSELASKLRRAVETSGIATIVDERPELCFDSEVESSAAASADPVWTVRIISESNTEKLKSYIGPFIVDYGSPIATGLSLDGVVWSGDETRTMPGMPLISSGDIPLLTEQRRRNGSRILTFQLNDRLSTLTSSPSWPILIWNILKYRASRTTGIAANNLKLGAEAEFVAAEGDRTVEIVAPDGTAHTVPVTSPTVRIPADRVGVYRLRTESGRYAFAVGALSPEESNLLRAETGQFGNWLDEETLRTDFRSIAWGVLLATLFLLTVHHWIVSVDKGELSSPSRADSPAR